MSANILIQSDELTVVTVHLNPIMAPMKLTPSMILKVRKGRKEGRKHDRGLPEEEEEGWVRNFALFEKALCD